MTLKTVEDSVSIPTGPLKTPKKLGVFYCTTMIMKIKISLELDLSETDYDIHSLNDVPFVAQNIRDLFAELRLNALESITNAMTMPDEPMKTAMLKVYRDDAQITKGMFDKFSISGTVDGLDFNV